MSRTIQRLALPRNLTGGSACRQRAALGAEIARIAPLTHEKPGNRAGWAGAWIRYAAPGDAKAKTDALRDQGRGCSVREPTAGRRPSVDVWLCAGPVRQPD